MNTLERQVLERIQAGLEASVSRDRDCYEILLWRNEFPEADGFDFDTWLQELGDTVGHGFPSRHVPRIKFVQGFQTGDIVKALVTTGKKVGRYVGRVAVRSTGSFNLADKTGLIQGISHRFCTLIHSKDGYSYQTGG